VMLASYWDSLPLPGKGRVKRSRDIRTEVEKYLASFSLIGIFLENPRRGTTQKEVSDWSGHLSDFVTDAFGYPEATVIISWLETGSVPQNNAAHMGTCLQSLIQRSSILPIKPDFLKDKNPEWKRFIDVNPDLGGQE
jgi:hypothetical protein